jgi:hypothetical protein
MRFESSIGGNLTDEHNPGAKAADHISALSSRNALPVQLIPVCLYGKGEERTFSPPGIA